MLAHFPARLPGARKLALERRVILARTQDGTDIDVSLGSLQFEHDSVARATPWQITGDATITTCCGEDMIVHKAFAGRDRDWGDIEGVLVRQLGRLNLKLVRESLTPLLELKEDVVTMSKLESLIERCRLRCRDD